MGKVDVGLENKSGGKPQGVSNGTEVGTRTLGGLSSLCCTFLEPLALLLPCHSQDGTASLFPPQQYLPFPFLSFFPVSWPCVMLIFTCRPQARGKGRTKRATTAEKRARSWCRNGAWLCPITALSGSPSAPCNRARGYSASSAQRDSTWIPPTGSCDVSIDRVLTPPATSHLSGPRRREIGDALYVQSNAVAQAAVLKIMRTAL